MRDIKSRSPTVHFCDRAAPHVSSVGSKDVVVLDRDANTRVKQQQQQFCRMRSGKTRVASRAATTDTAVGRVGRVGRVGQVARDNSKSTRPLVIDKRGKNKKGKPPKKDKKTAQPEPATFSVLDAVDDQHGRKWIQYGVPTCYGWVSVAEIVTDRPVVIRKLSACGVHLLGPHKKKFASDVEKPLTYRKGIVADRPGWCDGVFVFGDGAHAQPPGDDREVIVAFQPDKAFGRQGKLKDWTENLAPLLVGQPLMKWVLMMAFAPPLLEVFGAVIENHGVELVGLPATSKSTALRLAGSVWGGRPGTADGFGQSWLTTSEGLETMMVRHADQWLGLNETNRGNADLQKKLIGEAAFRLEGGEGKNRFGTGRSVEGVRLLFLSTSNIPIAQLLGSDASAAATRMRLTTLDISRRPIGVLNVVPRGYAKAGQVADAIKEAADLSYGSAARHFVKKLVEARADDEGRLKARIDGYMKTCVALLQDHGFYFNDRTEKFIAFVHAAGRLAQNWKCLPKNWGSCSIATLESAGTVEGQRVAVPPPSAAYIVKEALRRYVEQRKAEIVDADTLKAPLTEAELRALPGVWWTDDAGKRVLVIASSALKRFMPDYQAVVDAAAAAGILIREAGKKPKSTKKPPRPVCADRCRAYHFILPKGATPVATARPKKPTSAALH